MVEVQVEYDYLAQEPDELTIKKGNIIKDVIKKPGGWWEGVLNDKRGVFPDNFVKTIEKDSVVLRNKKDSNRIRHCRVVFSYNQDHEDELSLKVGDVINIIGEEEEGWWRGVLNGKEGVFPSNFVEEITPVQSRPKPSTREDLVRLSDDAPALPAKPVKQLCEVRYSYKAQNEDELNLKEGDIVTIVTKDCQDPGWWKGELNGKIGVFPDNFVVILPLNADDSKKLGLSNKNDSRSHADPSAIKHSSVASQRKSLENKNAQPKPSEAAKTTPPLPGKKPLIKKSPTGSSSGIFSKIKDKIADAVDGATGSKPKTDVAKEAKENSNESGGANTSLFDQVERRPLLNDVRANRARAPGRRLPTALCKDEDESPNLPNGTTDHALKSEQHSVKSEDSFKSEGSASSENLDSSDLDASGAGGGEIKPKLREWEKHKAPWLAEMKLNQAKRTSVSPVPELKPKAQSTPVAKPEPEVSKSSHNSPAEKEVNLIDMSKSMSDMKISPMELKPVPKPYKTPPDELERPPPAIKSKPSVPSSLSSVNRHSIGTTHPTKDSPTKPAAPPQPVKISPKPKTELYENTTITKSQPIGLSNFSSSSSSHTSSHSSSFSHVTSTEKVVSISSSTSVVGSNVTSSTSTTGLGAVTSSLSNSVGKSEAGELLLLERIEKLESKTEVKELLERVARLESKIDKQQQQIEDLKNRLQVETDMRMMLQEKVLQNNVQV